MPKILIIEDDKLIRANLIDLLQIEGFDTVDASTGKEGAKLAQIHNPDLIICDVMMPDLDGHGVLNQLRQNSNTAGIPFVFLTAKADRADFREAMALGANDYITKPYEPAELLGVISIRLEKQAMIKKYYASKLDSVPDDSPASS